jgi:putative flippase GtrA
MPARSIGEELVAAVGQHLRKWLTDPVDSLCVQVPRALLVSALAAIIDCAVLFFLVDSGGSDRITAAIVGYLAGSVFQYVLCSYWVFTDAFAAHTSGPHARQNAVSGFLAFTVLSLFGLALTWMTMNVLAKAPLGVAKIVALGLAFGWNFLSRKYLLFRPA